MTVLEYLQSLDLETRVAVVGCADNALRGIRQPGRTDGGSGFIWLVGLPRLPGAAVGPCI